MSIKFVDMVEEREGGVMGYERSVISTTLHRLDYLIYSFNKYTKYLLYLALNLGINFKSSYILHSIMEGGHISLVPKIFWANIFGLHYNTN